MTRALGADPDHYRRMWLTIGLVALICVPALALRFSGTHPEPLLASAVFGLGILGAAFLLSWGAETAEMDMSQGLALAIIAFIAVLPEYAVDAVLAWKAGADPAEAERGLAIANLTGGNRLLIGVGWPIVFAIFVFRSRIKMLVVDRQRSLELVFLAMATVYVILIPMRDNLALLDTIVLITMFLVYLILISRVASEEVELVGPARAMGALPDWPRRAIVLLVLVFAAGVILTSAEPFADGLVETGEQFGISEFLLIQWLAPLASESPEVLVAGMLAWRGRAAAGMGALISSKVNQWTLLVGTLPIAFALSSGTWNLDHGLPLDSRQREELFLTAAQSAFAIAVFLDMRMSRAEAWTLFVLFGSQLFITNEEFRLIYGIGYLVLCMVLLFTRRRQVPRTVRDAWGVARGKLAEPPEEEVPAGAGLEEVRPR